MDELLRVRVHSCLSAATSQGRPPPSCPTIAPAQLLRALASGATAELNPMAAMFGGFVGQEVVKALSGKFSPLHQWFYFDSVESMPDELLPPGEYEPTGTR